MNVYRSHTFLNEELKNIARIFYENMQCISYPLPHDSSNFIFPNKDEHLRLIWKNDPVSSMIISFEDGILDITLNKYDAIYRFDNIEDVISCFLKIFFSLKINYII